MMRLACVLALTVLTLSARADLVSNLQSDFPGQLQARVTLPVDGNWVVLSELMTVGSFYSPLYTYTSATPIQIDVTDLFVVSDRNEIYLDGLLVGVTPAMPDWQALVPAVGPFDDPPYTDDPAIAWLRPEFSKQSFALPAGTHVLTLRNVHIPLDADGSPFADGTVAFRLIPEPASALLLLASTLLLRRRRGGATGRGAALARTVQHVLRRGSIFAPLALVLAALVWPQPARAGTACGPLEAEILSGTLEIRGTDNADSIRVARRAGDPNVIEVFSPVSAGTPSCTFDPANDPFTTIRVLARDGDDLVIFDDSNGRVSDGWVLVIDGGDGVDVVLGGVDLSAIPLANALVMIDALQQARALLDRVLDLLDNSRGACQTATCLVTNTADVLRGAGEDLVLPTAQYVRDIESVLVQPSAAAVRSAHDRLTTYLQTFLAGDVRDLSDEAQAFEASVEVHVDEFELMLPMAQAMLSRAEQLYARASRLGLSTQSNAVDVFIQTVENHVQTIIELADLCQEDPEPVETEFNEDLQDPNGLPGFCAEVERRIEALEAIIEGVEVKVDGVEVEGDALEADGDALEVTADGLGDDEDPSSAAAQMGAGGDQLVLSGDNLTDTADALNADWELWVGQVETDLESRGDLMHDRGHAEVLAAADALEARVQAEVVAAAEALRAEAAQMMADLEALMTVAAPLLRDDLALVGERGGCEVNPVHTITGGAGSDVLIGTTGSDEIDGGDGNDLIVGAGGADRLLGGDGNDLIFGGGGNDEVRGGPKLDLIVGNKGDDCLFGGGGQTITRGSLTVEIGDLFFGGDGDDTIVSGESEDDELNEIDVAFGGDGDDRVRLSHGGTLTVGSFSFHFGNLAFGNDGDDDILTGDGVDVIFGGAGEDTIATGKGALLTIGSGSSGFRLALGDLIFGGDDDDTIHGDDPDADREDDDIDVIFGGDGGDAIHAYGGGLLSIGDPNSPSFELHLGNLVFGGDQDDEVTALDGIDVVFGGDGDDTITTGKGALLSIGSGNSTFRLALGDLIFGGAGEDELHGDDPDADRADDDIDVIFGTGGADIIRGYGGGLLSIGDPNEPDFELRLGNVLFGGDHDDDITALDGIDLIFAGSGDDTVSAGKGHLIEIDDDFALDFGDLIFGQAGDDTLHGDAPSAPSSGDDDGIDVIFGGPGEDRVYGGTGGKIELPAQDFCLVFGNLLFGGPGNDTLRGDYLNWDSNDPRGGIDLIFGAGGDDTIEGAGGSFIIIGDLTSGQVLIIGFGNLLFGGPGDDVMKGADAASQCSGVSQQLDDFLNGLGINDLLGAADLIFAGPGDDTVDAYNGIDFVFGGPGDDILRADHGGILVVPTPLSIAVGNIIFGGDGEDHITSLGRLVTPAVPPMELDLIFGGPCDDVISAGDGINIVFGNRANDTITAGEGVNVLFGNRGLDTITAGDGLNVLFGNADNDVLTAGIGVNVLFGNADNDTITGGPGLNVAFGGRGDDVIQAGAGVAILFGNAGSDAVTGGGGLSLAFGNRGDDLVRGGNGLAVLFGNAGNDDVAGGNGLCVVFGNAGHDLVAAGNGLAVLFGNGGEDRLRSGSGLSVLFGNRDPDILVAGGTGLFVAFGNNDPDVLVGGPGLNLLLGNRGNDQFFGGSGTNIAFGNADSDTMRGGSAKDFIFGNAGPDTITGGDTRDYLFGNRDDDCLSSDGGGDFVFGNRGNDHVRSGGDSDCDYLFGNRGNDNLYRCQNCDRRHGGRGNDTKHDSCDGCSLSAPSRGEVRGRVWIDLDGDGIGDVGQAGVTVSAGSGSAVTDADGRYRIAGLAVGGHTVSQTVPGGYMQVSSPTTYSITVGSMGIDLFTGRDFVNREPCFVSPDAWECLGTGCNPPTPGCQPIVVRSILRCPDTGAICQTADDCPCSECVPSWAVVECACNPECFVVLDPVTGPTCGGQCFGGGMVFPCQLVQQGDLYWCECEEPPCPTELAQFFFSGQVAGVGPPGFPIPPPWDAVAVGMPWTLTYQFARMTPDQNPDPQLGDYPAIVGYQLQVGPVFISGSLQSGNTLIRNVSQPGLADRYLVGYQVTPPSQAVATLSIELDDLTGTAWTLAGLSPRDALPLCDDVVLGRFSRRTFRLTGIPTPEGAWTIFGGVDGFECTDCAPPLPLRPSPLELKPKEKPAGTPTGATTPGLPTGTTAPAAAPRGAPGAPGTTKGNAP